jgi:hypothetical protein
MSGKTLSKTGPCPQLQVRETGIRGYLMTTVQKPAIGTLFALPSVWSYLWPKLPRMKASWLQPVISGQIESMLSFLVMDPCLLLWPMYIWWPALISQDPCILTNTKAPLGKEEWNRSWI